MAVGFKKAICGVNITDEVFLDVMYHSVELVHRAENLMQHCW